MIPFHLTTSEYRFLRSLNTPRKIQDFLETVPANEGGKDTCHSPRSVLLHKQAHCIEGAMLAALALRLNGFPPLIVDMESSAHDLDHVIAVYQCRGRWGSISKTNHAVLRYRDPVYTSLRELVMSYFHEYTDDDGRKTLRTFSHPVDLSRFDHREWMTAKKDVWFVPEHLLRIRHFPLLERSRIALLRRQDPIEKVVGKMRQWPIN